MIIEHFKTYTARLDYYGKAYCKFALRMDMEYDIYTRQVYSLADLLSNLGGIYSILFALGSLLVRRLSENMFYKRLIKDIY